jgi:aryl-alcohol dehydrogenase-like predicted oxidoreductase
LSNTNTVPWGGPKNRFTLDEVVTVPRGTVDPGVTPFDTAEVHGPRVDEEPVGQALEPVPESAVSTGQAITGFARAAG